MNKLNNVNTTQQPTTTQFRKPILSWFYQIGGVCFIALSALMFTGALIVAISRTIRQSQLLTGQEAIVAFGVAVIPLLTGLALLGMAQVITAIVETAFNTRKQ
jgi:hypothetical protein